MYIKLRRNSGYETEISAEHRQLSKLRYETTVTVQLHDDSNNLNTFHLRPRGHYLIPQTGNSLQNVTQQGREHKKYFSERIARY